MVPSFFPPLVVTDCEFFLLEVCLRKREEEGKHPTAAEICHSQNPGVEHSPKDVGRRMFNLSGMSCAGSADVEGLLRVCHGRCWPLDIQRLSDV